MAYDRDNSGEDDSDAPDSSGPNPKNRRYKKGGKVHGSKPKMRLDKKSRGGEERPKKWIQGAIKHSGALHKELHVPQGEKIPEAKLEKASHSSNPTLRKRANLAKTLKGFHH